MASILPLLSPCPSPCSPDMETYRGQNGPENPDMSPCRVSNRLSGIMLEWVGETGTAAGDPETPAHEMPWGGRCPTVRQESTGFPTALCSIRTRLCARASG